MKFSAKGLLVLILMVMLVNVLEAQEIKTFNDFSPEIQAKLNDNKSKGYDLFKGVNFRYNVTVDSRFKDTYPNDAKIEIALNQVKEYFKIEKYTYSYSSQNELLLVFDVENHLSFDEIKIKLTELKLYLLAINQDVFIK